MWRWPWHSQDAWVRVPNLTTSLPNKEHCEVDFWVFKLSIQLVLRHSTNDHESTESYFSLAVCVFSKNCCCICCRVSKRSWCVLKFNNKIEITSIHLACSLELLPCLVSLHTTGILISLWNVKLKCCVFVKTGKVMCPLMMNLPWVFCYIWCLFKDLFDVSVVTLSIFW